MHSPKERDLEHSPETCDALIRFLESAGLEAPEANGFRTAVMKAFEGERLRALRAIVSELLDFGKDLSPSPRAEFERLAQRLDGPNATRERQARISELRRMRNRGSVTNEDEYRLVSERLEEIWQDANRQEEVAALRILLGTFKPG